MSNTTLTSSIISKKALMVLENTLTLAKGVNRDYSSKFAVENAKIGATYNLRKPPRYIGREGEALAVEGSTESFVPVTVNRLSGVDISFSTTDLALNIEEFSDRFLVPAMASVANKIDSAIANLYTDVFRISNGGASAASYGTSGYLNDGTHNTIAAVQGQILTAGAILTESGVPTTQRSMVIDPMSQVSMITPMTALFNPSQKVSAIFEDAALATNTLGFDWAADPNIMQFTPLASGTFSALASVPASGATSLIITCTGTAVLPKGTILSMAGVYAINPQNRLSTGRLAQFVVTADTTLSAADVTIPIYPAYIPRGQFATCAGTPAGTAAVTTHTGAVGAAAQSQNMAFNRNAFALVTVDQEIPQGVHFAAREVYKNISLRIVRQYDINSNQIPARIECLFGVKTIYPELAVRLGG
jgi:hypothetical protein